MTKCVIADPALCIGCGTCMASCSTVHKEKGLQAQPRLTVMRHKQATAPVMCRHCSDAPCAKVCPVKAIAKEPDSIQLNESLCIGCTLCAIACPFGAIRFSGSRPVALAESYDTYIACDVHSSNPSTSSPASFGLDILAWEPGVKSIAVKCDLCYFREQGPVCMEHCPNNAISLHEEQSLQNSTEQKQKMAAADISLPPLEQPES